MTLFRVLFALCMIGAPSSSIAQHETFGVWRYSCDGGPCQIFFSVKAPDSDTTLVSMAVLHDQTSDTGSLMVEVPTIVALPPGLQFEAVDTTEQVPYQFCRPEGCVAILVLNADVIDDLSEAETATVSFIRYGSNEPEKYEIPAAGFADAYRRLRAGN